MFKSSGLTVVSSGIDTGCVSLGDNCVSDDVLDDNVVDADLVVVDVMGSIVSFIMIYY